jgi:hypothetical protein
MIIAFWSGKSPSTITFKSLLHVYVVADASVFIWGKRPAGELITVLAVERAKDIRTKSLLSHLRGRWKALSQARKAAQHAAAETGDLKHCLPLIWMSWQSPGI